LAVRPKENIGWGTVWQFGAGMRAVFGEVQYTSEWLKWSVSDS